MKVVISLGGSVLFRNSSIDERFLEEMANLIKKMSEDMELYVVVGGGELARKYIGMARNFCGDEKYLDEIGIMATRLNAMLLNSFFGGKIPKRVKNAKKLRTPVIMGGTTPGHSTDAVAAMLAKEINADLLIIATDVDGIYDKDPKKYEDARMLNRININDLQKMVGNKWGQAGEKIVIDAIACKIIDKYEIKTIVLNGRNLKNLENAIYGKEFIGTLVNKGEK